MPSTTRLSRVLAGILAATVAALAMMTSTLALFAPVAATGTLAAV